MNERRRPFTTLPEELGDETQPLRVLLSSCYFTGNKRSRLAASMFSQLDRNGLRHTCGSGPAIKCIWTRPGTNLRSRLTASPSWNACTARRMSALGSLNKGLRVGVAPGREYFLHRRSRRCGTTLPIPTRSLGILARRETREAWFDMARPARRRISRRPGTAQRFSVSPLDFLILDARVNRKENRAGLFSADQWTQLRAVGRGSQRD